MHEFVPCSIFLTCNNQCEYIAVLDTETTGLEGIPYADVIIEIAILKVCKEHYNIEDIYDTIIKYPLEELELHENAWVFKNTGISMEKVLETGKDISVVVTEVTSLLKDLPYTSYNTHFDYYKFLRHPPWLLAKPLFCLMVIATDICKLKSDYFGYKYPKLSEAYKIICKDPSFSQTHRAKDDALMASRLLVTFLEQKIIH